MSRSLYNLQLCDEIVVTVGQYRKFSTTTEEKSKSGTHYSHDTLVLCRENMKYFPKGALHFFPNLMHPSPRQTSMIHLLLSFRYYVPRLTFDFKISISPFSLLNLHYQPVISAISSIHLHTYIHPTQKTKKKVYLQYYSLTFTEVYVPICKLVIERGHQRVQKILPPSYLIQSYNLFDLSSKRLRSQHATTNISLN